MIYVTPNASRADRDALRAALLAPTPTPCPALGNAPKRRQDGSYRVHSGRMVRLATEDER